MLARRGGRRGSKSREKRFPPRQGNGKAGGGGREARTRFVLPGEPQSVTMVLSAVGGIGGTVSAGAPRSRGRRQNLHPNAPLGDLLGWVSFSFGAHRSGVNTLGKRRVLLTNPLGPSGSDGWSYYFCSLLFKAQVA